MRRTGGLLETGKILYLPAAQIRPNPGQPRKIFDPAGLQELAASIAEYGIVQPLTVRRRDGFYELVAGERRLRAARMAGLREVPCILLSVDEAQSGMVALVENLQRRDLDYIEEAEGLARLMRLYGLSQEQAAQRVGKSQSAVANKLRLLRHRCWPCCGRTSSRSGTRGRCCGCRRRRTGWPCCRPSSASSST